MGKIKINKFNIWKKIVCLILCLFCAFAFVGCEDLELGGSGDIGGGDGGDWPGTSPGGGSSGSTKNTLTTDESYLGVVAVYDIDSDSEVFYDKWNDSNKTFAWLVDRQFTSLSSYLYDNLVRIYGDETPSNSINNYGASVITYAVNEILSDGDDATDSDLVQSDIAGLSSNGTANKGNLNYKNTINGGYQLTGSGSSWAYGGTVNTGNAWKAKDSFSQETLKKALAYVYKNTQKVTNVDAEFSLNSDANSSLKDYYKTFDLANEDVTNYSIGNQFDMIGFSKEYMWNVLYMISYSVIGENRIQDTLNNTSTVFSGTGGTISSITDANKSSFEKYKGYDIVLTNLVTNAFNASIDGSAIIYKNYFEKENWDTTLYPTMKRQEYVFYDDLDLVMYDEEVNKDPKKLRSLIYIPNITDDEFIDTKLTVGYIFVSINTNESDNFRIEVKFDGTFDNGALMEDSKMIFDNEYDYVENDRLVPVAGLENVSLVDGYVDYLEDVEYELGSAVSGVGGVDLETLINNSFVISDYVVEDVTHKRGTLNLYNQFIDVDEKGNVDYRIDKNYYYYTFNYYDADGNILTDTPEIYLTSLFQL